MFNNVFKKNIPRKMIVLDVGARGGLCEPYSDFLEKNDKQLVKSKYKSFFVYKIFYTLVKLFEPNHHGWSPSDPLLGNKKIGGKLEIKMSNNL